MGKDTKTPTKHTNSPIPELILNEFNTFNICPFCGAKKKHLKITKENRKYIVISQSKVIEGPQYFYHCLKCEDRKSVV